MLNSQTAIPGSGTPASRDSMLERRARVLGSSYRLFYDEPLRIERAHGVWIYDTHGRPYLDAYNNVPTLGHSHPAVLEAVSRALSSVNTHTRYLIDSVVEYAEALVATVPAPLSKVIFNCSGSEAVDLALRIARAHSGAEGVIVTQNAYHGVTHAAASCSPSLGPGVPRGVHVRTVAAPDVYREGGSVRARFLTDLRAAIDDLTRHGIRPAAFICDSIFSSDGIQPEPVGLLSDAADAIRAAGGVYVADEVQSGFSRTGEVMWGFERHRVVPDVVVLGKGMGNGLPIAAVISRAELMDSFGRSGRYFSTFGGNPVCTAAGATVLEVLARERLQENALAVGQTMVAGLRAATRPFDCVGDVRGAGLAVGVEIVTSRADRRADPVLATRLVNLMRETGVLIGQTGRHNNVLKIRPPLIFSYTDTDVLVEALGAALKAAAIDEWRGV